MTALAPIDIFRVANILGEGILWDWRRQALWWTDIQGRQLRPRRVFAQTPDGALDVLCVTSSREGLDSAIPQAEPHAGDVFSYRTGVQGLPESEYRP